MTTDFTLLALGGPAGDAFAAAAGVAAAILLLSGPILLRFQRQRHQFLLTRAALERGITRLPSGPPAWLQSSRTGVILLSLGAALFICGIVSTGLSKGATMPERQIATTQPAMESAITEPRMMSPHGPPDRMNGPGPHGRGPMQNNPGEDGPPGWRGMDRGGPDRDAPLPPPPVDPVMERWHQAQAERAVGLTGMACGFILGVMGLSRLLFARVERKYEPISNDVTPSV